MKEQPKDRYLVTRRQLLKGVAVLGVTAGLAACAQPATPAQQPSGEQQPSAGGPAQPAAGNPLAGTQGGEMRGKKLELSLAVIAGWPPSQAPIELFPDFAAFAKDTYGYEVSVRKTEAPFAALFQKVAPTLASRSQEYNLIVSDSQWLGALAEPGWIVKADDVFALVPELDIEPYSTLVRDTYQVYPDGSGIRWGFPQMPDTQGMFVRLDVLKAEAENYKAATGKELPLTYEELSKLTIQQWEPIWEFLHNRNGMAATAIQQSKEYDFFSCAFHPYVYATGGDIWDPKTGNVVGVLNTEANAKQLEYFRSLQKYQPAGSQNFGIGEVIDLFVQGKVVTAFQWLAVGLFMKPEDPKAEVLALPHPRIEFPGGPSEVIGAMGGQPWVINRFNDDDHMRACIDFLKWWYTDETQKKFLAKGGLPWSKRGIQNPLFEGEPPVWFKPFVYMLEEGRSRDFWHLPEYAELLAIQQEAYNGYAAGQYNDPKAVLDSIAARQQALLYDKGRTQTPVPDNLKNAQPR
ncbi:MAG: substrate-binding domain-containing protein [Anaerolineae bacterium]|nr:substrate-binding domain-containing protein [Anaerolineae bacterium]